MEDRTAGRHGYWVPLVLLGFGLLGLLAWDSVGESQDFGWFAYAPADPGYQNTLDLVATYHVNAYLPADLDRSPLRDWPWTVLVTGTLVATVAWYGRRARRGSPLTTAVWAVGAGAAVLVAYAVVGMAGTTTDPAGASTSVGLPLLGLGGLLGAWAYFRLRSGWRAVVLAAGAVCLVAGAATVLGAWASGTLEPVIIAGGLLVLARFERSRLLVAVALAVLVALVAFPVGTLSMLLPATILLAGAIVALVRQRGTDALA